MDSLVPVIYQWKRAIIAAAVRHGLASLHIVAVPRKCKTCDGTGEFKRWDRDVDNYYEGEDCRRCGATGNVVLRFVEARVDRFVWHTPRPKWDLGIFEEDDWTAGVVGGTDWEPEQPGRPIERMELIRLLNQVEAVMYEAAPPPRDWGSLKYSLHLGKFFNCWICGGTDVRNTWDVYRTDAGLRWESGVCEDCWRTAKWTDIQPTWPMNLHHIRNERDIPQWHDHVPLPAVAFSPDVLEWMARRQIFPDRYPPASFGYTVSGDIERVLSATPTSYTVEVVDNHYNYRGPLDGATVVVNELGPSARNCYLPEFDWAELRLEPFQEDKQSAPGV